MPSTRPRAWDPTLPHSRRGVFSACGKGNSRARDGGPDAGRPVGRVSVDAVVAQPQDRKSTRLNSSHQIISYAVFCLKKKTKLTSQDHILTKRRTHS